MENKPIWKEYEISQLFYIEKGKGNNQKDLLVGINPYVSATNNNNGIVFYSNDVVCHKGNSITVSDFGQAFYQSTNFSGTHIIVLVPKFNMNKEIGIFVSTCITKTVNKKYSFGYAVSSTRFAREKVLLPSKNDEPDYEYMENFIKEIYSKKQKEMSDYITLKLKNVSYKNIDELKNKKWKEYNIDYIFNILPGKRLEKRNMMVGTIPFIGASYSNNGITNYVSNINNTLDRNVLGVNYNGSVVENFYHKYKCIFSDDVKRFHLKEYIDNEYVLLFFKTIILMQKNKYKYGYKFNESRMKRQKILIPVNSKLQPDYEYMEQFIKNIMYKKYNMMLKFLVY